MIKWMNRKAMIERGTRMFRAHWRNFCCAADLDRWFEREVTHYAATTFSGKGVDRARAAKAFWLDCEKRVVASYGMTWNEYMGRD